MLPKSTLEQWIVLKTVVELGGYAQAAAQLNRSQSSISYALQQLQDRLGVPLLKIQGRKSELTSAGALLLAQATPIITTYHELEMQAQSLRQGIKPTIHLVIDTVFPKDYLFQALQQFQLQFPKTQVHVTEVVRSESEQKLAQGDADLYLIYVPQPEQYPGSLLLHLDFIAVAAATHPLHQQQTLLTQAQLAAYPRIAIADQKTQQQEKRKITASSEWILSTVPAAIEAIRHGVGFGWLPLNQIQPYLDSGELKPLPVEQQIRSTPVYLITGEDQLFDPTVTALAELLKQRVSGLVD